MLVSRLVIFFPVMHGGSTVHVGGEFVEFGSSLVRVRWHIIVFSIVGAILESFHCLSCPIKDTCAAATCFRIN
jgi:hypothetical protein